MILHNTNGVVCFREDLSKYRIMLPKMCEKKSGKTGNLYVLQMPITNITTHIIARGAGGTRSESRARHRSSPCGSSTEQCRPSAQTLVTEQDCTRASWKVPAGLAANKRRDVALRSK